MSLLFKPLRVLIICIFFATLTLLFNGSFYKLYKLHRDEKTLISQISEAKAQVSQIEHQLKVSQEPSYIARQALDHYDLANEHDLIFVFPE